VAPPETCECWENQAWIESIVRLHAVLPGGVPLISVTRESDTPYRLVCRCMGRLHACKSAEKQLVQVTCARAAGDHEHG